MNIYGLSIPNFFVAILVGIILSVAITALMTPNYDHTDTKPIQTVAVQPTIQTIYTQPVNSDIRVLFNMLALGLFVIAAVFIIGILTTTFNQGDY